MACNGVAGESRYLQRTVLLAHHAVASGDGTIKCHLVLPFSHWRCSAAASVSCHTCCMIIVGTVTGRKGWLGWTRQYLVAVTTKQPEGMPAQHVLQIHDLRNKLIACSLALAQVLLANSHR